MIKTSSVKLFFAAAIIMVAVMTVGGCGGGKGGAAVSIDSTNAKPANSTISGTVKIKGTTNCSGVVVVADKTVKGVTRSVHAMLTGAKVGRKVEARSGEATAGVYMTTTSANCSFTLTLPEDTYSVSAYKEDTVGAQPQRVTARSAASVTVNFELVATGKISGVAQIGNGSSDVVIIYLDGTSFAAFATPDGDYTISNIPVGIYTIKFSRAGVIYAGNDGVEVIAGATTTNTLTSLLNPVITGTVTIMGLTDCSGVEIVAQRMNNGITRTVNAMLAGAKTGRKVDARAGYAAEGVYITTTGSDCSYTLSVPEGTYSVSASKADTSDAPPQTVVARLSTVITINFVLVATGSVSGTAVLGNPGSDIVVVFLDGTSFAAFADPDGAYTINNAPVGTYTIKFARAGIVYSSNSDIVVTAGATTTSSLTSVDFLCVIHTDCDDANTETSDICVDPASSGASCTNNYICGDGIISGSETCDDGNTDNGDGCSAVCALEP